MGSGILKDTIKNIYLHNPLREENPHAISIEALVFKNFFELVYVYMPTVEIVGRGAFNSCHKLVEVFPCLKRISLCRLKLFL